EAGSLVAEDGSRWAAEDGSRWAAEAGPRKQGRGSRVALGRGGRAAEAGPRRQGRAGARRQGRWEGSETRLLRGRGRVLSMDRGSGVSSSDVHAQAAASGELRGTVPGLSVIGAPALRAAQHLGALRSGVSSS